MSASATIESIKNLVNDNSKSKVSEEQLRVAEEKILSYGRELMKAKNVEGLASLLLEIRPLYDVMGKAKSAKLIRDIVELCLSIEQSKQEKISLVVKCIEWAKSNNRIYLRRSLESRLIRLHNENGNYVEATKLAAPLIAELKKQEDRELLMEVTLEDSKSAFYLKNYAKSKAALVIAKTSANGAFVSTQMQANLDMHSGVLYCSDEKDYKTAYSYFYEAFEGFQITHDKANSAKSLKYMCLCKIMSNEADQIAVLLSTKVMSAVKSAGIEAMREMAAAFKERSLKKFQQCMDKYRSELIEDSIVAVHSQQLHHEMLEKEISRVVEPYSEIDLVHISAKVGQEKEKIEKAVAKMILDKKTYGCIDQHLSTVQIHRKPILDKTFQKAVELIHGLSKTVDATYEKAAQL